MKLIRILRGMCWLGVTLLAPAIAHAQATFHHVGDLPGGVVFSDVRDATKVNGVVYAVGGTSSKPGTNKQDTAFLWTSSGGMTALPDLVPGLTDTNALIASAITPDARYIASRARYNPNNSFPRQAVRVTTDGLTNLNLGGVLTGSSFQNSVAAAISGDGSVLYGFARYNNNGRTQAVRWTVNGTNLTPIPFAVAGDDQSGPAGRGTSADGTVMVGTSINSAVDGGDFYGVGLHAFRYVHGTGVATIAYLAGGTWNGAMAVSPNGNLVLVGGDSAAARNGEVYLYNAATGATTALGTPAAGWQIANVSLFGGMTADGSLVVAGFGTADGSAGASFLRNSHGWHDLQSVIAGAGVDLTGWTIDGIYGMSADGTLIWGSGIHNSDNEGVVVEFPAGYLANYVGAPPALSIVGSWSTGDTTKEGSAVVTFLNDGYYFQVEDATTSDGPNAFDGIERGTYTWDPVTKAFKITSVLLDTNGSDAGASSALGVPGTLSVVGDYLSVAFPGGPDPSGNDSTTLVRVSGPSPIVGSWVMGNPALADSTVVLTFLANGAYFLGEDGDSSVGTGDPRGRDGMERGSYAWNPATGAFSATTLADTNGQWGLSHPKGTVTAAVNADILTLTDSIEGSFKFDRVRYIPPRIGPVAKLNYQGLWWNAPAGSEAGWGINFAHQGDTLFATWFTYGADGKPLWLMAVLRKSGANAYSGEVSTTTGPAYDAAPFDSSKVVETVVGTMAVTFSGNDNATMVSTVNGIAQNKSITRQVFASPVPTCSWGAQPNLALATNFQDLWWNSAESGWGINLTHQGDIIFATWFTYGADGKPTWLIAVAYKSAPQVYAGALSTVTGPPFGSAPFDPAKVVETVVGTASFTFADGNRAAFAYTVNGKSQAKDITRQVFALPGTVCF